MSASHQAERPPKKPRYEKSIPFEIAQAIEASMSPGMLETNLVKQYVNRVETDTLFFPDTAREDPRAIEIGKSVKRALSSTQDEEEKLRNAIYTDLKRNHGINFPASAEHGKSERTFRSWLGFDFRYKENSVAHVLHELCEENSRKALPVATLLGGLNVTTTSRPNMTVLKDGFVCFGEFKNNEKYTTERVTKQCILYLYALMYFLRVRVGLPIEAVFGFWVCGPRCFDGTEYCVGFVRLSAPEQLGDSLVPKVFMKFHKIDSVDGIQDLVCFLQAGKIVELNETVAAVDVRSPALLSLPTALWGSPLLVPTGTASMVFKGNGDDILGLLSQLRRAGLREYFDSFLSSARSLLRGKETTFFLKIRLRETTLRDYPSGTVSVLLREKNDLFKELYPIKPFGDGDLGLLLMNNCGDRVDQSAAFKKLGFRAFCACFATLREDLTAISDVVLHGDALPHNMVYNESSQRLVLIDFDEGVVHKDDAHQRAVQEDDEHAYLRYPNFLRVWWNRQLYTELQLAASFLLLEPMFEQTMERDKMSVRDLREAATTANSFLERTNDRPAAAARGSAIDGSVYRLVELLQETLKPQAN